MTNKYFIVTFIFGLTLWSALVTAAPSSLIVKSCHGSGSFGQIFEQGCINELGLAPKNQHGDVKGLALYTLRFVETNVANFTTEFGGSSKKVKDFPPAVQESLKDCAKEYTPLDVLVKEAINSVSTNAYPKAEKSINKAIYKLDKCGKKFKQDPTKEKSFDENMVTGVFLESNEGLKNYLSVTLNILKANK